MDYLELIKKFEVDYEIVRLKHEKNSYAEIANHLNINKKRIGQRYNKFVVKLFKSYFIYLRSIGIKINSSDIWEFFYSWEIATAYLEQTYEEPLRLYRYGAPPLMIGFCNVPPYRQLTDKQIRNLEKKIVKARDTQKKTFTIIGNELNLTREKTKRLYELYYHCKVLRAIDKIEPTVDYSFTNFIFSYSYNSRNQWNYILENHTDMVQDLID